MDKEHNIILFKGIEVFDMAMAPKDPLTGIFI
jgi:hypothetical protein